MDFLVNSKNRGSIENNMTISGTNIYRTCPLRTNLLKNIWDVYAIIKKNKYDIVHIHSGYKAFLHLFLAKLALVKVRIVHTHNIPCCNSRIDNIFFRITRIFTLYLATSIFSCGYTAAQKMWGDSTKIKDKLVIIPNAIKLEKYQYSEVARKKIRTELNISDEKKILINVARLDSIKNQLFLLDVFIEIIKKDKNFYLLFVGNGDLKQAIEEKIKKHNISENVMLLGIRHDIPDLLSAADIFVLPSLKEGFGIAALEAQASGLPVYLSSGVPTDVCVTANIIYLNLKETRSCWANTIIDSYMQKSFYRQQTSHQSIAILRNRGYDIDVSAESLLKIYKEFLSK